jgi:hypothetical protein
MEAFDHRALGLQEERPLVYTAFSKHYFYYRMHISKFVLEHGKVPLNPFMVFDYFLLDTVERDLIRQANNSLVKRADELWVFGPVSNGVLVEILIAKEQKKLLRFFKIQSPHRIIALEEGQLETEVELEADIAQYRKLLVER